MGVRTRPIVIGVMGAGACDAETARAAEEVGELVAVSGSVLLCGGREGVMEAAARGAKSKGGLVIGVLPGRDERETPPNPYVDVAIFTGMNDARNWINACSSDGVIALVGGYGTLSEISFAMILDRPVVVLGSWTLDVGPGLRAPKVATDPSSAVAMLLGELR